MKMWSEEKMLKVLSVLFLWLFISLGITSTLHILSAEHQQHCLHSEASKTDTDKGTDSQGIAETYYCHLDILAQTPLSFTPYFTLTHTTPTTTESYTLTIEGIYPAPTRLPFALRAPPYLV